MSPAGSQGWCAEKPGSRWIWVTQKATPVYDRDASDLWPAVTSVRHPHPSVDFRASLTPFLRMMAK